LEISLMAKFAARCPGCHRKFPWDPKLGYPTRCPLPGCDYTSPEMDPDVIVIAAPFIRSANTGKTDAVYRELERTSEVRAQMAADMAGVSVSEMSHLKVTNLKDNTRPGEVAAMPVVNAVTQQMDYLRQRGQPVGFQPNDNQAYGGASTSGAVTVNGQTVHGIEPRAGVRAMDALQARFNR
jgi:hypothetical protein